jgi:hypothetical protein
MPLPCEQPLKLEMAWLMHVFAAGFPGTVKSHAPVPAGLPGPLRVEGRPNSGC